MYTHIYIFIQYTYYILPLLLKNSLRSIFQTNVMVDLVYDQ